MHQRPGGHHRARSDHRGGHAPRPRQPAAPRGRARPRRAGPRGRAGRAAPAAAQLLLPRPQPHREEAEVGAPPLNKCACAPTPRSSSLCCAPAEPSAPPRDLQPRRRCRTIAVLGRQHAGKSALINTYRRAITGHDCWSKAPVGRYAIRGTDCYEPYYDQEGDEAEWLLLDTAGRSYERALDEAEQALYSRMLEGMEWKVDMCHGRAQHRAEPRGWQEAQVVPENAVDHVIFVIPATDVVSYRGAAYLLSPWGRWEASLRKVQHLAPRFRWWERRLGNAPFVAVTHMDLVGGNERLVRETLGAFIHKNRIFCLVNPDDPNQLSPETERVVAKLHVDLRSDVEARSGKVLRGRNALRGPQWRDPHDADSVCSPAPPPGDACPPPGHCPSLTEPAAPRRHAPAPAGAPPDGWRPPRQQQRLIADASAAALRGISRRQPAVT
eukprot:TRINITY_DN21647_c0_g1_i1.p1 TRINITY_DN21647_c0_g1~~TRINITY_DN21647_c0_g1_i1.p1  ORF type:complete len:439 (+),score=68.89 TRINITY_DN21647_c0_g1_i1:170-1486(+)